MPVTPSPGTPSPQPSSTLGPTPGAPGTPEPGQTPSIDDPRVTAALDGLTSDAALVGQLLMLGWSGTTPASVDRTLTQLQPGGIVYVGANASTAAAATAINAEIEAHAAGIGLLRPLIAIDQEGGSVERIQDVPNLGSNLAFGATLPTDAQAFSRGAEHASELSAMGFSMNLAPVLDVLTNPRNTVIGDRSYGSDPNLVARLGAAYIQGLQTGGIAAVAKHFPGHGDTSVDSHFGLPVVHFGLRHLEQFELVPFVRAMQPDVDVSTVMVGHLALPKLDPTRTPASLSGPITTGLLRDQLGFSGLVITDDLGAMQAVTDTYTPAEAAVEAIRAGADMVLIVGDVGSQSVYRDALLDALASGAISRDRLLDAVRHVLATKLRFGLL
jgi:beta-N-acetylhexosaminidase